MALKLLVSAIIFFILRCVHGRIRYIEAESKYSISFNFFYRKKISDISAKRNPTSGEKDLYPDRICLHCTLDISNAFGWNLKSVVVLEYLRSTYPYPEASTEIGISNTPLQDYYFKVTSKDLTIFLISPGDMKYL